MSNLKLILVDPKPAQCDAWKNAFAQFPNVNVVLGYFEELPQYDCMVSAGNSFGLMDGGVDLAIVQKFGRSLESKVQEVIIEQYLGEQPVGTAFVVETDDEHHPFLIHAPTMRTPLFIRYTDYPYLAMWAVLRAVHQHNLQSDKKIMTLACPGLGTGTGQVEANEAARQMVAAYQNYLYPPEKLTWRVADARQEQIKRGGDLGYLIGSVDRGKTSDRSGK